MAAPTGQKQAVDQGGEPRRRKKKKKKRKNAWSGRFGITEWRERWT
jgi:hypothetical protein